MTPSIIYYIQYDKNYPLHKKKDHFQVVLLK